MKNIFKCIGFILLFTFSAQAGLPPTSKKGQTDAGNVTTFSALYPNQTVYHNGTVATITRNGAPTKNYIQYADFENNATTGWTLGTIGTLTNGLPTGSPTFGSGASGNLSLVSESATPLAGVYSLGYVSSAATTAGNMVASSSVAIDQEDTAKVLTVKFYLGVSTGAANVNASATSSNSYAWAAYDVTNSAWLSSAGNFCMSQTSMGGYCTGTLQTGATTANIRFVVYNANATAGAATLYLDDFYVGPQTAPSGPAMSDWVAYTPTFTGFGTPTGVSFFSRRNGGDLQVHGVFTAGTTTAVQAQITLGYNGANTNVTIDTTKIATGTVVGDVAMGVGGTISSAAVLVPGASTNYLGFGAGAASGGSASLTNGNAFASSVAFTFDAEIPIVGWPSNSVQSSDTATNVVAAALGGTPTGGLTGSLTAVSFPGITKDTNASYSGSTYTVGVTGWYTVQATLGVVGTYAASAANLIQIYKNGSMLKGNQVQNANSTTIYMISSIFSTDYYNAGDTIQIYHDTTATSPSYSVTAGYNWLSILRASGPAVITSTETTSANYNTSSSTLTGALATVTYSNKIRDDHASYASGIYTIPVSGSYMVTAGLAVSGTFALNGTLDLQIQQSGSASQIAEQKIYAGGVETALAANVSTLFYCLGGDTIKVQASSSATTPVIVSSASQNYFSIVRVGN